MHANEIRKLNWVSVTDWSELSKTRVVISKDGNNVSNEDIDSFVENIFRSIARRLNMTYSELEPILKEENSAFYSTKARVFGRFGGVPANDACLLELQKILRIPDVTSIPKDINKSDVDKILDSFSALTDMEKLEVLQRLGTISVKIEYCDVCGGNQ